MTGGSLKRLPKGSGTILVADDDQDIQDLTQRILRFAGYTALPAMDGPSAVETLRRHPEVRLVLLDLNMPGARGVETVESLRQVRQGVPILVMSGYTEPETRERLGSQEVDGLLEKPFQPPELIDRIRRALGEDE